MVFDKRFFGTKKLDKKKPVNFHIVSNKHATMYQHFISAPRVE